MAAFFVILLALFLLSTNVLGAEAYNYPAKCKIGFRLDDIQEYWLVDVQIAVMTKFAQRKVPLTIGIIDNFFGLSFDPSSRLTPFIRNQLGANAPIEICFHSPDHLSMDQYNLTQQMAQLNQLATNLYGPSSKLPENPHRIVTVIPPYNAFNADTLQAMRNTGYTTISSSDDPNSASENGVLFYNDCPSTTGLVNGIYHYPEGAYTWEDATHQGIPASRTIDLMRQQIVQCGGFTVVMLHFEEFADKNGAPLASQLAELDLVIDESINSGCDIEFLRDMGTVSGPTASRTPTSISPTNSPTPQTDSPTAAITTPLVSNSPTTQAPTFFGQTGSPTVPPTATPTAYTYPTTCRVAFRIDQVQETNFPDAQISIMTLFAQRRIPLSIGIIGNQFGITGTSRVTPWLRLKFGVDNSPFEIVNNGANATSFSSLSLADQQSYLQQFQNDFYGNNSKVPENKNPIVSFSPPSDSFNSNTLQALRNSGYTTISGRFAANQASDNGVSFYSSCSSTGLINGINHYPAAVTVGDTTTHIAFNSDQIISQIRNQINQCSYAVIAIDYQAYLNGGALNTTTLQQLDLVITEMVNSGCSLRTLRNMGNGTTTTPSPTSAAVSSTSVSFLICFVVLISLFL